MYVFICIDCWAFFCILCFAFPFLHPLVPYDMICSIFPKTSRLILYTMLYCPCSSKLCYTFPMPQHLILYALLYIPYFIIPPNVYHAVCSLFNDASFHKTCCAFLILDCHIPYAMLYVPNFPIYQFCNVSICSLSCTLCFPSTPSHIPWCTFCILYSTLWVLYPTLPHSVYHGVCFPLCKPSFHMPCCMSPFPHSLIHHLLCQLGFVQRCFLWGGGSFEILPCDPIISSYSPYMHVLSFIYPLASQWETNRVNEHTAGRSHDSTC